MYYSKCSTPCAKLSRRFGIAFVVLFAGEKQKKRENVYAEMENARELTYKIKNFAWGFAFMWEYFFSNSIKHPVVLAHQTCHLTVLFYIHKQTFIQIPSILISISPLRSPTNTT